MLLLLLLPLVARLRFEVPDAISDQRKWGVCGCLVRAGPVSGPPAAATRARQTADTIEPAARAGVLGPRLR